MFEDELYFLVTPERKFYELIKGCTYSPSSASSQLFSVWRNNKLLFMVNDSLNNKTIYCNYTLIWSIFESKFKLDYYQIGELIKSLMDKTFSCKVNTPDFTFPDIGLEKDEIINDFINLRI